MLYSQSATSALNRVRILTGKTMTSHKTYVYTANNNELLIDDDGKHVTELKIRELLGLANIPVKHIYFHPSRSHKNQHIHVVLLRHYSVFERIALQAILGSDSKREALSLRSISTVENPVVLFAKEPWKEKVAASECDCKEQNKGGTYCVHVRPYTHFYKEYELKEDKSE